MVQRFTAALAAAIVVAACAGEKPSGGDVQVRVDAATYQYQITRISLDVQPAGVQQDLAYDQYSGVFTGRLVLPAGVQTVTATAWSYDQVVGVGSAVVEIVGGATAWVALTIYDTTGPPPLPDHAPIITSFVVSMLTPGVGEPVALSAAALDPDGTPVTYEWSQSCATGSFSDRASPVTTWTGAATGACTLTLVASSNGLSDVASAAVYVVDQDTGYLEIGGSFVPSPVVQAATVQSYDRYRSIYRYESNVDAGVFPAGEPITISVSFDLGTYQTGAVQPSLTDACGGAAVLQYASFGYATFFWTPPAGAATCVLRAGVEHAGLRDEIPFVLTIEPCSSAVRCSPWLTCEAGTCLQPRTITGSMQTTYWDGPFPTVTLPSPDVGFVTVEALVPTAAGFASYPGTLDWAGSFYVGGVPPGRYLLSLTEPWSGYRTLIDTASDSVDLGADALGRPNQHGASGPTPVTLHATGLEPWRFGDQLQLTSIGAGFWDVASDRWEVPEGAVELLQTEDWQNNLPDASLGDVVLVHQLAQRDAPSLPGVPYLTAVAAQALSVTIPDLVPTAIEAALAPVGQTGTVEADWLTSAFEAHLPDMGPTGASPGSHMMWVDATPGTTTYPSPGPTYGWPDLMVWEIPAGTPDFATGRLSYGQFLPGWNEFRFTGFSAITPLNLPGAIVPRNVLGTIGAFDTPAGTVVVPRISPVRAPAISGMDLAGGPVAGAGLSPVLSWSEPATGPADRYVVQVFEAYVRTDGRIGLRLPGVVYTRSTSVPLPLPFVPGAQYFARIYAYSDPGSNVEASPFRSSFTSLAYASRITALWTP